MEIRKLGDGCGAMDADCRVDEAGRLSSRPSACSFIQNFKSASGKGSYYYYYYYYWLFSCLKK